MRPLPLRLALILCMTAATAAFAADTESEEGFTRLMDGATFAGWTPAKENSATWVIEDGCFVSRGPRCHLFYTGDAQPFKNFELKVEVMTEPGANGVWGIGQYENAYVKERGTWKISKLHFYVQAMADYDLGFSRGALRMAGPSALFPPDRPPTEVYRAFPSGYAPPFSFVHPVTGEPTTTVVQDTSTGRTEYDPSHPDADETGYVHYPNVDLATETVDLMIARRMHEANATVFQSAKAMLRRTLEI